MIRSIRYLKMSICLLTLYSSINASAYTWYAYTSVYNVVEDGIDCETNATATADTDGTSISWDLDGWCYVVANQTWGTSDAAQSGARCTGGIVWAGPAWSKPSIIDADFSINFSTGVWASAGGTFGSSTSEDYEVTTEATIFGEGQSLACGHAAAGDAMWQEAFHLYGEYIEGNYEEDSTLIGEAADEHWVAQWSVVNGVLSGTPAEETTAGWTASYSDTVTTPGNILRGDAVILLQAAAEYSLIRGTGQGCGANAEGNISASGHITINSWSF